MKALWNEAIELLKEHEPKDGYYLAFSGGKDSIVCYDLLVKSGVKFDAHYNSTTIDPPELLRYMKENYPDVEWHYPVYKKKATNFYQLVRSKGLPTRKFRWCCGILKEGGGFGRFMIDGIRAAESHERSKREKMEYFLKPYWRKKYKGQDISLDLLDKLKEEKRAKKVIHVIFSWSDAEIWEYIKSNDIPYCKLYDRGWHRIGCICCPAKRAGRAKDLEMFPTYKENILKSIKCVMNEKGWFAKFEDETETLNWWLSEKSEDDYLAEKANEDKI